MCKVNVESQFKEVAIVGDGSPMFEPFQFKLRNQIADNLSCWYSLKQIWQIAFEPPLTEVRINVIAMIKGSHNIVEHYIL